MCELVSANTDPKLTNKLTDRSQLTDGTQDANFEGAVCHSCGKLGSKTTGSNPVKSAVFKIEEV